MDPTNTRRATTPKANAPLSEKDKAEREVMKYVGLAFIVFTLSMLTVGAGLALTTKLKTPTNDVVGRILILLGGTVSIIVSLLFLRLFIKFYNAEVKEAAEKKQKEADKGK